MAIYRIFRAFVHSSFSNDDMTSKVIQIYVTLRNFQMRFFMVIMKQGKCFSVQYFVDVKIQNQNKLSVTIPTLCGRKEWKFEDCCDG
jgi:hypothetical protein